MEIEAIRQRSDKLMNENHHKDIELHSIMRRTATPPPSDHVPYDKQIGERFANAFNKRDNLREQEEANKKSKSGITRSIIDESIMGSQREKNSENIENDIEINRRWNSKYL